MNLISKILLFRSLNDIGWLFISLSVQSGAVLGSFTYLRGYLQGHHEFNLALIIGVSMTLLVLWANLLGALLPLLLKRLKLDPAVVSSPFIATLIDATGILIYFHVAMFVLE